MWWLPGNRSENDIRALVNEWIAIEDTPNG